MAKRLYSHGRVKYWYVYDIDDVCALFSEFGLHAQTVRKWVKNGLKTIDNGKPALIYGNDLIEFLKKQNSKGKCPVEFNEMYCLKCQDARPIFQRKITIKHRAYNLFVSGCCRECKTQINKTYKMDDLPKLKRTFQLVDVLELYDCEASPCKTHLETPHTIPLNESSYGTPYGDLFE